MASLLTPGVRALCGPEALPFLPLSVWKTMCTLPFNLNLRRLFECSQMTPSDDTQPLHMRKVSSREEDKLSVLTCTGPCPACCPAGGQGSRAVSPWRAKQAAPGSCCCPRNSGGCPCCTPPGRRGPSSGSAHSSWGCPGAKEGRLSGGKGLHLSCPAHLPTLRVFVYCSQQSPFQRGT